MTDLHRGPSILRQCEDLDSEKMPQLELCSAFHQNTAIAPIMPPSNFWSRQWHMDWAMKLEKEFCRGRGTAQGTDDLFGLERRLDEVNALGADLEML